jgi:hypothetical protein
MVSLTQNAYYIAGENPKAWSPAFYSLLLIQCYLQLGYFLLPDCEIFLWRAIE